MKKLLIGLLMLGSVSVIAQTSNNMMVTVDVGGCINARLIPPLAIEGNDWELRLIPINRLNREIKNRIEKDSYSDEVQSVGAINKNGVFKGPMLESNINLQTDEKIRVEIWDNSRGMHNFFMHEGYSLGEIELKSISKNQIFVKGKAIASYANDCLIIHNH